MLDNFQPPVPREESFDSTFGLEFEFDSLTVEHARAHLTVHPGLFGSAGCVHGGVYAAAAEALASWGTAVAAWQHGSYASGMSNDTRMMIEVTRGELHFIARRRMERPDLWVWEVQASDQDGRACAFSAVAIAVRPLRPDMSSPVTPPAAG